MAAVGRARRSSGLILPGSSRALLARRRRVLDDDKSIKVLIRPFFGNEYIFRWKLLEQRCRPAKVSREDVGRVAGDPLGQVDRLEDAPIVVARLVQ
jgi:hypothetical protein